MIGIGFSGAKVSLEKLPGWEHESWAYHGDDGMTFCCQNTGRKYGPMFTTGDVVGCGVNFLTGCAFFTKNGVFQGITPNRFSLLVAQLILYQGTRSEISKTSSFSLQWARKDQALNSW